MDTKLPVKCHKNEKAHQIPVFLGRYNTVIHFISSSPFKKYTPLKNTSF